MGLDSTSGTITPGKRADVVVLDADPLATISAVRRIHAVIADGRMYDPAPLWRASGFQP
jgi:imidazolonepropionase-like amidohydrolase